MRIDHVRLLVVNFAECFRFYRDIIGLEVKWGDEEGTYASFHAAGEDNPNIALFDRKSMAEVLGTDILPSSQPGQDRGMLIIGVEDVDATVAHIQELGVELVLGPRDFPDWGMRSAYLRDPDGNLIELTGALPKEAWTQELRDAAEKYEQS